MFIQVALIVSVILQFAAFVITLTLIRKTKFTIAWISISLGFLLMAFRRLSELCIILRDACDSTYSEFSSWIAVIISVAMLIAAIYINKIFTMLEQLSRIREENEARVLTAVISTEEKERKYFAKELHDGLGPILSSIKMTLSALNKSKVEQENLAILEKAEFAIDHAITTTKEISNHLNPQLLERFGLEKALKTFIKSAIHTKELEFAFECKLGTKRYPHETEVILYRIACELINNTLKHADATKANLAIFAFPDCIEMLYEDNGVGFEVSTQDHPGMGLTNIRSRIKSLHGKLDLKSKPEQGLFIKIELPL